MCSYQTDNDESSLIIFCSLAVTVRVYGDPNPRYEAI